MYKALKLLGLASCENDKVEKEFPMKPTTWPDVEKGQQDVAEIHQTMAAYLQNGDYYEDWSGIKLPLYDGSRDPAKILEWIEKMELFFDATRKQENQKVVYGIMHLTERAHTWCRNLHTFKRPQQPLMGWNDLKQSLMDCFMPHASKPKTEKHLWGSKQEAGMSLEEYNDKFLTLYLQVPEVSEAQLIRNYVDGLDEKLKKCMRRSIEVDELNSVGEAMRIACELEDVGELKDEEDEDGDGDIEE